MLYTEDTREKVVAVINKVLDTNKDCSCEVELKALLTKALTNLIKPTPNLNVKPPEVIMVS